MKPAALVVALLIGCGANARATVAVPALTGPVVDEARVFSPSQQQSIESGLAALENGTGVQMAVLTVPTLNDETIEQFSMRVVDKWRLGRKGDDRGLLFVFAPEARKMRLEVGYGLEGDLPDALAKRIVADRARPYFADKNYFAGTEAVIDAVTGVLKKGGFAEKTPPTRRQGNGMSSLVFFVLLFAFAMIFLGAGRRRRRFWGGPFIGGGGFGGGGFGGGGSSGGFSGGGGGFGGGGASSDW